MLAKTITFVKPEHAVSPSILAGKIVRFVLPEHTFRGASMLAKILTVVLPECFLRASMLAKMSCYQSICCPRTSMRVKITMLVLPKHLVSPFWV